jgi:hypothetical protein
MSLMTLSLEKIRIIDNYHGPSKILALKLKLSSSRIIQIKYILRYIRTHPKMNSTKIYANLKRSGHGIRKQDFFMIYHYWDSLFIPYYYPSEEIVREMVDEGYLHYVEQKIKVIARNPVRVAKKYKLHEAPRKYSVFGIYIGSQSNGNEDQEEEYNVAFKGYTKAEIETKYRMYFLYNYFAHDGKFAILSFFNVHTMRFIKWRKIPEDDII